MGIEIVIVVLDLLLLTTIFFLLDSKKKLNREIDNLSSLKLVQESQLNDLREELSTCRLDYSELAARHQTLSDRQNNDTREGDLDSERQFSLELYRMNLISLEQLGERVGESLEELETREGPLVINNSVDNSQVESKLDSHINTFEEIGGIVASRMDDYDTKLDNVLELLNYLCQEVEESPGV